MKVVLGELGWKIKRALQQFGRARIIDGKVLNDCWFKIACALLESDVEYEFVLAMKLRIMKIINPDADSSTKRTIFPQAIFDELCTLFDSGNPSFAPEKGKTSVILFVGFQGSGKTTTCSKYAYYHQKKGWKPALVCADTYRPGAFDQLQQNSTKSEIPFYGSCTESDPVKIAVDGIDTFKKDNHDLIIVDASLCHKQEESESEASLFQEMHKIAEATNPDLVVFVMDSCIGHAAFRQAEAFRQSVVAGSVIVTKVNGRAKGGGVLSAVAATKTPVIFIGTGEHMDEFEVFDVKPFVSRLLGIGDFSGFMGKIQEVPMDPQPEHLKKLSEGNFTLRSMYELFQNMLNASPIPQVGQENERQAKMKCYMTIMDSMTNEELDSSDPELMNESQTMLIARGSGRPLREVMEMIEEYKRHAKIWSKMMSLNISKKAEMSVLLRKNVQHMGKVLHPQMLKQIGGLVKQMGNM